MNEQQLKAAIDEIQQSQIDFYLSKHISEVKDMNDMDHFRFFRGQQLYADRCKALLKAALEAE